MCVRVCTCDVHIHVHAHVLVHVGRWVSKCVGGLEFHDLIRYGECGKVCSGGYRVL